MLIKGEDKRGFSQEKSADQIRFFPASVCSADFRQGAVTVVEFGSRPAKRARLLSEKDSAVKKDQVRSICSRGLAQSNFLEKNDGNVARTPPGYQSDEPMSENNSGVTNEPRSGLNVISTSEHMEMIGNTKVPSEPGGHEKTSLLDHENAGSEKVFTQHDADDTVSTSDDDGLFVIQVRSPKSRQLLHSRKQDIDQEKLPRSTIGNQDSHDNSETLLHRHEGGGTVGLHPYKSVTEKDGQKTKIDAEEVDSSVELSNIIFAGADSKSGKGGVSLDHGDQLYKVIQKATAARVSESERCEETGVNSSDIAEDYAQTRKRSSPTQAATIAAGAVQDKDDPFESGDALDCLHLEDEDPPGERIIKHYVRRSQSRANSHGPADITEKPSAEEPVVNSSEVPKVYVRSRKQRSATVGAAALREHDGSSKSEDTLHRFHLEGGDPLGESIIKHYVRRPHSRAHSHGPADMTDKSSGLMMNSATNVSACSPQAEHHKDLSARVETEGILSVFPKTVPSQEYLHKNDNIAPQKKMTQKRSPEACYVRADHQPKWLPDGWTLEIRNREGKKTPARIRDKYYHDHESGHRFRSRNEVLQFLDSERLTRDRIASDGMDTRVQVQDEKNLPSSITPAEPVGFQSPVAKSSSITQKMLGSRAAPSPPSTNLPPAHVKISPATLISTEPNRTPLTWAHVEGPIQLPCSPRGGAVAAGTDALKNAAASAFDEGAANGCRISKSREGDRLPTANPVLALASLGEQGNKENRGKLILRLKRKQPDSDVGKGKSKRPTYEVVHVERPPLFPSPPPQQTHSERLGPDAPPAPVEPPVQDITYERPTSINLGLGSAAISNHWSMSQTPLHLDVFQQEPFTALGIPATARTSGLQTMASYSANHTHVFLDPVENTIPLSWQYPFTTSVPTFGPFSSVRYPPVSATFSITTTVPIPSFEHFPGVSPSNPVTVVPCSENRSRHSVNDVELGDSGSHQHKAHRPLTKGESSKLLLGLGRRLCQVAGLERKTRGWTMQSR